MAGPPLHDVRHGRLDHVLRHPRHQGDRPVRTGGARGRRGAVRGRLGSGPDRRRRERGPDAARHGRSGAAGGQQGRSSEPRLRDVGVARAGLRRPPSCELAARPGHRRPARRAGGGARRRCRGWRRRLRRPRGRCLPGCSWGGGARGGRGRSGVGGGAGGAAQYGQVHAVQPAHRRGPISGARPAGHHPRHRRHPGGDPRRAGALHRHRGDAAAGPHRLGNGVLLAGAGPSGGGHSRCGPAGGGRLGRGDPSGSAARGAGRRRGLPHTDPVEQVGSAGRRGPGGGGRQRGAQARVPGHPAGAENVGAERQGCTAPVAGAGGRCGRVPHPHPHPARERPCAGRAGCPARAGRRPNPLCHAGSHRSAHVHAVREPHRASHLPALHRAAPA